MATINPILNWDSNTLQKLEQKAEKDAALFETFSKVSHFFLGFFGIGVLMTFGTVGPSYTVTVATLVIVGYGPAYELTAKAWSNLAEKARKEGEKYRNINRCFSTPFEEVPELKGHNTLLAQWMALAPLTIPSEDLPKTIQNLSEGEKALRQYLCAFNIRVENCHRKIYRAYLIHVAQNPSDTRKVAQFGRFSRWYPEHAVLQVNHAIFGQWTMEKIERETPQSLAQKIFKA